MQSVLTRPTEDPELRARSAEIVAGLSRRGLLTTAGGLAPAGLSGCGNDDTGAPPAAATRTVHTAGGDVTVPADPRRMVCLDYFTAIFLVELGRPPVGGIDHTGTDASTMYPDCVAPLLGIADIGKITATDIERIAALHPDLILGPTPGSRYDNSPGAMRKAKELAPVFPVDFGTTGD